MFADILTNLLKKMHFCFKINISFFNSYSKYNYILNLKIIFALLLFQIDLAQLVTTGGKIAAKNVYLLT